MFLVIKPNFLCKIQFSLTCVNVILALSLLSVKITISSGGIMDNSADAISSADDFAKM